MLNKCFIYNFLFICKKSENQSNTTRINTPQELTKYMTESEIETEREMHRYRKRERQTETGKQ